LDKINITQIFPLIYEILVSCQQKYNIRSYTPQHSTNYIKVTNVFVQHKVESMFIRHSFANMACQNIENIKEMAYQMMLGEKNEKNALPVQGTSLCIEKGYAALRNSAVQSLQPFHPYQDP
jgi:hypothetical protein